MAENLKHRAYKYALQIIACIDELNTRDISIQIIAKQLLRSATSIGANIIEAQAASSKKDFINFYSYSLKSANETKFWLALLRDSKKVKKISMQTLLDEVTQLSKILGASIVTAKKTSKK